MTLLRPISVGVTALALGTSTLAAPPEGTGKPEKSNGAGAAPASKQNGKGDKGGKAGDDADWAYRYHNVYSPMGAGNYRAYRRRAHIMSTIILGGVSAESEGRLLHSCGTRCTVAGGNTTTARRPAFT